MPVTVVMSYVPFLLVLVYKLVASYFLVIQLQDDGSNFGLVLGQWFSAVLVTVWHRKCSTIEGVCSTAHEKCVFQNCKPAVEETYVWKPVLVRKHILCWFWLLTIRTVDFDTAQTRSAIMSWYFFWWWGSCQRDKHKNVRCPTALQVESFSLMALAGGSTGQLYWRCHQ